MGKIIVSENISLDGVIEDPTGEDGFGRGGWGLMKTKDREAWAKVLTDEALGAEALLMGRRTYEYFAARFPSRSGRLVPALLEHDLVDELRLMTFPCVAGAGERLFGETSAQKHLRLVGTGTVGDGLVLLTYQPVQQP